MKTFVISFALLLVSSMSLAQETSDFLTIQNIRTYESGFIVKVAENVNPNCGYPSTLQLYLNTSVNYQASTSLFLSAFAMGQKIKAYYSGCNADKRSSGSGNVHVTGWEVHPQ